MIRSRGVAAGGRALAGVFAILLALGSLAGCGAGRFSVGSVPFPAKSPVFVDETGTPRVDLPDAPEPIRILFLDFPWCPPCNGMWEEIRTAAGEFPPGTIRIDRILFDRETMFPGREPVEVPPLVSSSPRRPPVDATGGIIPATTWTALPGPFRKQYQFTRVPVLLLLDRKGAVVARWAGTSPSLAVSLAGEIRKRTAAPPSAGR